jgi:hypothetical protein
MNTIAEKWQEYKTLFIPMDAGKTQVQETRRVFYAGALAYMAIVLNAADKKFSDEAGAHIIKGLEEELKLFCQQVIKGEA